MAAKVRNRVRNVRLESGDLVVIRTRRGYYFNAWDSSGDVGASVLAYPPDLNMANISDEIFTLIKVGGSAGNTIQNEDRIVIRTPYGYYFNADGSRGKVSASRLAYYPDPTFSDEIFTILLGEAIAYRAEVYHQFKALYQTVLGLVMDDDGWQTYFTFLANGGALEQVQVRNAIAQSAEAANALKALHQEVWGRPIDAAYLNHYTFLLSTDGTLADVRADMEALHLETVVVPVLSSLSILLQ
jgi:hypothetical protein